jgi:hypothetical protein
LFTSKHPIYQRATNEERYNNRDEHCIKRLDDCFGDFLVRVVCECGACREIQPQALARLVGSTLPLGTRLVPIRRDTATPVSGAAAGQGTAKRSERNSQAGAEGASHGCEAKPELLITISSLRR